MNKVASYIEYFKILVSRSYEINSFYMMDVNEPLTAFHSDMKFPMLILHALSGKIQAQNLDNVLDNIQGGFMILDFLSDPTDFNEEMALLDRMKSCGMDIILKMQHDSMLQAPMSNTPLKGFNFNSVNYQMIDGIWDKCFGFMFTFSIDTNLSQSYNPFLWSKPGNDQQQEQRK